MDTSFLGNLPPPLPWTDDYAQIDEEEGKVGFVAIAKIIASQRRGGDDEDDDDDDDDDEEEEEE